MSTSQTQANSNLDASYGSGTPATIYVALAKTLPLLTGDGTYTPPSGTDYDTYAIQAVTNNTTNFPAASGGQKKNGIAVTFPVAGSGSTTGTPLPYIVLLSAASGGHIIDALATPAGTVVTIGQAVTLPANSIIISEG